MKLNGKWCETHGNDYKEYLVNRHQEKPGSAMEGNIKWRP